jgi:hypothetical protein
MTCSGQDRPHANDSQGSQKNAAMTIADARFPADDLLQ